MHESGYQELDYFVAELYYLQLAVTCMLKLQIIGAITDLGYIE